MKDSKLRFLFLNKAIFKFSASIVTADSFQENDFIELDFLSITDFSKYILSSY